MELSSARHAFVTGGASGIGLAIVDALLARGVCVTAADVDKEALAAESAQRGSRFLGIALEVRDRSGWSTVKQEAEARFCPVDVDLMPPR